MIKMVQFMSDKSSLKTAGRSLGLNSTLGIA